MKAKPANNDKLKNIEVSMAALINRRIPLFNDMKAKEPDICKKASLSQKIDQLYIDLYRLQYADIFKNPAILISHTDTLIGCIKVPCNSISFLEYKRCLERRIGVLIKKYIQQQLKDVTIEEIDNGINNDASKETQLQSIVYTTAEWINQALDIDIHTISCTVEDIQEAILESSIFRKWLYQIELRFKEKSKNHTKEIDIHGNDPDLAYQYQEEAYSYVDKVSLEKIIEALYFYKDE